LRDFATKTRRHEDTKTLRKADSGVYSTVGILIEDDTLRVMSRTLRVVNWVVALCGLWEFGDIAALFVPGFGQVPAYMWNHIGVGVILMVAGGWAALTRQARTAMRLDWLAVGAGVWLIVASFTLGKPAIAVGLWNDVAVGIVAAGLGAAGGLWLRRRG
jgi:hypothetical protein